MARRETDLEAIEVLMANERTMLAYALVAILLITAGIGLTFLLVKTIFTPVDYAALFLILAGLFLGFYGTYSYLSRRREILKKHARLERLPF